MAAAGRRPLPCGGVLLLVCLCLLVGPIGSALVPNLPTPPASGGPDNGGQFRFATVSWIKVQHDPPIIRFTVEAAFRRGFTALNFQGSGADGLLVVRCHQFPPDRALSDALLCPERARVTGARASGA